MNMLQHAASTTPEPHGQRSLAMPVGYDSHMLDRADDMAKLTVLDERGNAIELGTFWRDQTAVLVFTRHFG
jgi:hypothetical protein